MTGRLEEQTSELRTRTPSSIPAAHSSRRCCRASPRASSRSTRKTESCSSIVRPKRCFTRARSRWKAGRCRRSRRPRRIHARRAVDANVIGRRRQRPTHSRRQPRALQDGAVLTFDDITDQLTDQRRAAWSDIARRIAHEIRNPLTPIQLAAERLQRRFGKDIGADKETFERLTETIVRQVGDLAAYGGRILQLCTNAKAGVP